MAINQPSFLQTMLTFGTGAVSCGVLHVFQLFLLSLFHYEFWIDLVSIIFGVTKVKMLSLGIEILVGTKMENSFLDFPTHYPANMFHQVICIKFGAMAQKSFICICLPWKPKVRSNYWCSSNIKARARDSLWQILMWPRVTLTLLKDLSTFTMLLLFFSSGTAWLKKMKLGMQDPHIQFHKR